jgi:transposase-like protein
MGYPVEFKQLIINKTLSTDLSQQIIAKEAGIGYSTLQKWLRQHRESGVKLVNQAEKRPHDWTPQERLNAVLETTQMNDTEIGAWCRQQGLYTHHLKQWKQEALAGMSAQKVVHPADKKIRTLNKENRMLKKDLRRKEKALAEVSALLVLKKKANLIWGEDADD